MLSFVSGSSWPDLCAEVYQSPQTAAIDLQIHRGSPFAHRALAPGTRSANFHGVPGSPMPFYNIGLQQGNRHARGHSIQPKTISYNKL